MNSRIEKDLQFYAAIHYENQFLINSYFVTLSMLVDDYEDDIEPHIALERTLYYIENKINNSLFINENEKDSIELYKNANIQLCILPSDPSDEIVAAILMLKLNAIMEKRIKITDITICSNLGNNIRYNIVSEIAEEVFQNNKWYNRPCLSINDYDIDYFIDDNVVKLFRENKWAELGLDYKQR